MKMKNNKRERKKETITKQNKKTYFVDRVQDSVVHAKLEQNINKIIITIL